MPVIGLLTDFGTRDHYVAAMKGVILRIAQDATLVDITHDVAPQDVLSAAFELAACYREFPSGTIFVVVVDPGVGTARRAIAGSISETAILGREASLPGGGSRRGAPLARRPLPRDKRLSGRARAGLAAERPGRRQSPKATRNRDLPVGGEYVFVGPDNGVLAPVLDRPGARVVELTNPEYERAEVSRTFEGRDRFAPAAAWLARGVPLEDLGPAVERIAPMPGPEPHVRTAGVAGEVLKVDRFGNLISNVRHTLLTACGCERPAVRAAGCDINQFVDTYGEAPAGALCALVGSSGYLEIAVNGGSAAERLHAGRGTAVYVGRDRAALDTVAGPPDRTST